MRYLLLTVFLLGGCESMPRGELAFQAVHALDVMQTYNTAVKDSECFQESGPIVKHVIGENPSDVAVIGWALTFGLLHYSVSLALEEKAPKWASAVWQGFTIGGTTLSVMNNHQAGARPWGDNQYSYTSDCYAR